MLGQIAREKREKHLSETTLSFSYDPEYDETLLTTQSSDNVCILRRSQSGHDVRGLRGVEAREAYSEITIGIQYKPKPGCVDKYL